MTKLLYITNARIPTEKAHGLQIVQNCEAFADAGLEVELWCARRLRKLKSRTIQDPAAHTNPWAYYGVKRNFAIVHVPCFDLLSMVGNHFLLLTKLGFLVQAFTFAVMVIVNVLQTTADIYYSRDLFILLLLSFIKPQHRLVYEAHRRMNSAYGRWFQSFVVRRVGTIIPVTPQLGKDLITLGANPTRVLVAHDGIRGARFSNVPDQVQARRELGWPADAFIVGYVGRLHTMSMDKGVGTLVEALRQVEGVSIALVGGPDDMAETLRQQWVASGLPEPRFLYTGHVLPERVPVYLSAFDVCAMPFPWTEHFAYHASPIKLFEYMASKRTIVASDLPAFADVVRDSESALLVPPSDVNALAAAIIRLRDDPTLRTRLADCAFERVMREYTWEARASAILNKVLRK
jgi:glycosyltransferase involved in cell wall biosynthesis